MTHDPVRVTALDAPVDLTNCDREPIHIPGAVQPHGAMVALRGATIVQVSENLPELLGVAVTDALGGPLEQLLDGPLAGQVREALRSGGLQRNPLLLLSAEVRGRGPFDVTAHQMNDLTILEFEQTPRSAVQTDAYSLVRAALGRLNAAPNQDHFVALVAQEVQALTGFDRVMVYQFADDGTGTVIAERSAPGMTPYLGLRYPASDIPKQARALYVMNMLRIIADANYTPVPLLAHPGEQPLDMSYCALRSVSPIHLEYLRNMGVGASMSISLLRGAELWGLIACHHTGPRALSANVRAACELIGQVASVQLSAWQERQDQTYQLHLKDAQSQLMERLANAPDLMEALVGQHSQLLEFVDASGAAVCLDGEIIRMGRAPTTEQVRALQAWLGTQAEAEVLHTRALSELFPDAAAYADTASGLLSVQLSRQLGDHVMWFRPEELQTVTWGGDPNKPAEVDAAGQDRLSPRRSFEAWQQTVRSRSTPWLPEEIAAARTLRRALLNIVLRRAEEIRELNDDLTRSNLDLARSNADLDAFAYIASHDLKEPLRGLHNYSMFLLESYAQQLDEDGVSKLNTLVRLTQRMDDLIDSLLLYSRMGRVDLSFRPTDLNDVLHGVLDVLSARLDHAGAQVHAAPLPTLLLDRVRVGEILNNLITNAVKYTDKAQPVIEVGAVAPGERGDLSLPAVLPDDAWIIYVRDNGIGIHEKHFENIFRIFKRLHARDQFGGGTGAGLTIVKKLVERHGGLIWLESVIGQGTTFYFTLNPGQAT
ncbi:ATP-binding protein [Deinococcus radiotolerans]|uniref:histidine kinase n=1 Tax=Deinococcus radiotolerans TaxID=1309407 RepID=A0ABQ2FK51_9DEIO|nr:ATP-binding protein [Deinococcus radiotolerans]GGL00629.1 histidine kinase [Deinococcus radiotolerans]